MSNANRDQNKVTVVIGQDDSSNSVVEAKADETTHRLLATYLGNDGTSNDGIAKRDENHVPVFMAVSADDGETPVAIFVTSDGKLLI